MPNTQKRHVDQLLSNVAVKYRSGNYIADKVFPMVPVKKDTDLYRVYERNFRIPETKKAAKGIARQLDFDISTSTYVLEKHALVDYISKDEEENYDLNSLKVDTTEELTDAILRRREKSVADLFTTTSWSNNVSLAAAWSSNTTTTNPIPTMDSAASVVLTESGLMPNFAQMDHLSYLDAKNHVSILDRVKHTSREMNENILAGLFDIPELLIGRASSDTAAEGLTQTVSFLWGRQAFVGWKAPRASFKAPSCGYIFQSSMPMVRRWKDEAREAEAIEVQQKYQPKVVASLTGFLVKGT